MKTTTECSVCGGGTGQAKPCSCAYDEHNTDLNDSEIDALIKKHIDWMTPTDQIRGLLRAVTDLALEKYLGTSDPAPPTDPLGFHYAVYSAVLEYFAALYRREDGGVAQSKAMGKIQGLLGMHYDVYRTARDAQEKKP